MYFLQIGLSISQGLNTILGGKADETLSSRCWRLHAVEPFGRLMKAINFVVFWQDNHCQKAHAAYLVRKSTKPA